MSRMNVPTGSHPAEPFIRVQQLPMAVIRSCTLCKFSLVRKRAAGRSAGFVLGNKQRGEMIQHIKACHPEALTPKNGGAA